MIYQLTYELQANPRAAEVMASARQAEQRFLLLCLEKEEY
jgi:hypothetical protein